METLSFLPIGRQYFADVRKDGSVYVDKTEYIYQLCQPAFGGYFLSRPRRFGKSLTLDTIHQLFAGKRELFKDLWIEDKWDWLQTFPVIRLSFENIGHEEGLRMALLIEMSAIAATFELTIASTSPRQAFRELITKIAAKTSKKVVILVDEYDKPIVDYIDPYDFKKANEQRDILKYFYAILKSASNLTRFLFVTGVSKFSKVAIFSDLNHLFDITLAPRYAGICGYTQTEL